MNNGYFQIERHHNYYLDTEGNVYRFKDGKYVILSIDTSNGHARVNLDGKNEMIARLVGETFIPNPIVERTLIFHLDGNQFNNKAENLVWVTPTESQLLSRYLPQYRNALLYRMRNNSQITP